jgi:hypothetical protein
MDDPNESLHTFNAFFVPGAFATRLRITEQPHPTSETGACQLAVLSTKSALLSVYADS